MTGNKLHIVAQRQQFGVDRRDQVAVIATRKIGTTNRAFEQHITDPRHTHAIMKKHHMTRRMAGAMQYLQTLRADLYFITVLQITRRRECFGLAKTIGTRPRGQVVQPILICRMRPDDRDNVSCCRLQCRRQSRRTGSVIQMTVREQNLLDVRIHLTYRLHDGVHITARINHRSRICLRTHDDGAVLCKRRHGNNVNF